MRRLPARSLLLFSLSLQLAFAVGAQQPQPPAAKASKAASANAKTARAEATDPLAEVRRTTAISLVNTLADDARSFRDLTLRARIQSRAADALWETDKTRASALFRRAWEAAETADEENDRRRADALRAAGGSRAYVRSMPSMRREVLRLAARRDRALGEEFLAKMDEARKQEATNTAASTAAATAAAAEGTAGARINPDNPPPAMFQRLTLARQLLEDGEVDRAVEIADPALYPVNTYSANFLDMLRERNSQVADQRYLQLLARVANDPLSDANSISLLSSYVFTPYLYLTFQPSGSGHTRQWVETVKPPDGMSQEVRAAFLRTAAAVLLRPLPPADQDRSTSGRGGAYVVLARMAPLFEQHAPDLAASLRARLAALQQDTPEDVRRPGNHALTVGIVPDNPTGDRVQELLDGLEKADTPDKRDAIYSEAAFTALRANQDPTRARELADKVSDIEMRKQVRAFIDFAAVNESLRKKNADETLRLARSGELTPTHRTWALTEAVRLLAKPEPGRALEVLEEALTEAKRIDAASPDRVRALVAIATQFAELDRARVWELMSEVVKASNASEGFTGEDAELVVRVLYKRGASTMNISAEAFNLPGLFALLAREDFNRAAELARSFTGEYPRAVSTLTVARSVLDKRK